MKKALVELGSDEEEGENESKVINQTGAGAFHSAGQSKEGNFVLALPSIRFS